MGRLRGHQCGTWKGDCIGANQQGHGCLQRDGWSCWEQPCPELPVLASESPGCAGSLQCAARVQGCGESCAVSGVVFCALRLRNMPSFFFWMCRPACVQVLSLCDLVQLENVGEYYPRR